jgi:hypothetical protein
MYIPIGLTVIGGIIATWYRQYMDNRIMNFVVNIFQKTMYMYTILEYRVDNLIKKYRNCKSTYFDPIVDKIKGNQHISSDTTLYIKNNVVLDKNKEDETGFDIVILKKQNNVFVDKTLDSILDRSTSESSSMVSFITFNVTIKTDENVDETFSLVMEKNDNYIQIGNKIDKYVIWYLVKEQCKRCIFEMPYTLQLMDGNINMYTLSDENTLTILEDSITTE